MLREIKAIVKKDLKQAKRDPRFMGPSLIVPFVLLLVYSILWTSVGGGESFVCGLVVEDQTVYGDEMASIIENMRSTTNHTWFKVTRYSADEADQLFNDGNLVAFIVIPEGFGGNISAGLDAKITIHINNANDDIVKNYVHRIQAAVLLYNQEANSPDFNQSDAIVAIEEDFSLESTPSNLEYTASAAIILSLITCSLTSQALGTATEFENKAVHETLNSPTSRATIVIGKVIASVPKSMLSLLIAVPVIFVWQGIYPSGNPIVLLAIAIFTVLALVPIGEMFGLMTKTRENALLAGVLFTVLSFFIGGGLAPVALLPFEFRVVTLLFPTTHAIAMWNRAFFFNSVSGLLLGFTALGISWLIGTLTVVKLTDREAGKS